MEKGKTYYVVYAPPRTDYVNINPVVYVDEAPSKLIVIDALGRQISLDKATSVNFYETIEAAREAADKRLEKIK